jgi:hypothetical protein
MALGLNGYHNLVGRCRDICMVIVVAVCNGYHQFVLVNSYRLYRASVSKNAPSAWSLLPSTTNAWLTVGLRRINCVWRWIPFSPVPRRRHAPVRR